MPDAEIWRGLQVCEEQSRDGDDRDAFGTGYRSLEDDIIAALPVTMRAAGQVYTRYSCLAFDIAPDGTAATDIEHIVALAEAHDSRIADGRRREIASDLDNLTIADPTVNHSQKSDRDAASWIPARHGRWFAERVIAVKLEYGLSVDRAERDALEALLAGGGVELNCVDADTTSPTVVISSDAVAPVTGPFSIAISFSEPVRGFEIADLVVGNGSASALEGEQLELQRDDHARGLWGRDGRHRGRSRGRRRREPKRRGRAVLDRRGPDPGADEPVAGGDGNPAEPDAGAGRHRGRGRVRGVRRPRRRQAVLTASSSAPGVVTACVTDAFVMLAAASERAATIRVTATDPGGLSVTQPFTVTVVSVSEPFTDHPIRSGVTLVKAVHFTELRARIDVLRRAIGLQPSDCLRRLLPLVSYSAFGGAGFQENIFEPVQAFVAPRSSSAAMCSTTTPSPSSVTRRVPQR